MSLKYLLAGTLLISAATPSCDKAPSPIQILNIFDEKPTGRQLCPGLDATIEDDISVIHYFSRKFELERGQGEFAYSAKNKEKLQKLLDAMDFTEDNHLSINEVTDPKMINRGRYALERSW